MPRFIFVIVPLVVVLVVAVVNAAIVTVLILRNGCGKNNRGRCEDGAKKQGCQVAMRVCHVNASSGRVAERGRKEPSTVSGMCGGESPEIVNSRSKRTQEFVEVVGGVEVRFEFARVEAFAKIVEAAGEEVELGGEDFAIGKDDVAPDGVGAAG